MFAGGACVRALRAWQGRPIIDLILAIGISVYLMSTSKHSSICSSSHLEKSDNQPMVLEGRFVAEVLTLTLGEHAVRFRNLFCVTATRLEW